MREHLQGVGYPIVANLVHADTSSLAGGCLEINAIRAADMIRRIIQIVLSERNAAQSQHGDQKSYEELFHGFLYLPL